MAKQRRKLLDDVAERLRNLLGELERLINPQPQQKPVRVPVPVPVPVQPQRRPRLNAPYR
ncbi:MAG: hypothetical protein L6Q98_12485 [Anaerolineae bacterium]|nr:hypothetical protein [Anaerolineae bacterium]NUQ04588.1 hypothetical protein [Anaerolineae bacterium]